MQTAESAAEGIDATSAGGCSDHAHRASAAERATDQNMKLVPRRPELLNLTRTRRGWRWGTYVIRRNGRLGTWSVRQ
jgi:hypothetical protein